MVVDSESRDMVFERLVDEVNSCRKCERMNESARILGHGVGDLDAEIMFIGEAPGRLGADQTSIPFHGDVAGDNFEELLDFVGITRDRIYVTNAVLCNPRDAKGNNATPVVREVLNCSGFLKKQIDLVDPKIIVTLGATALKALENIENHGLSLRDSVRTSNDWFGRVLVPLYHPGKRAMIHRSFANQRSDYQFVAETLKKVSRKRRKQSGAATRTELLKGCIYLIKRKHSVSYFELHKLAYLAEYLYSRKTGNRLTQAYFIRQKDGPYCVDLSLQRLRKASDSIVVSKKSGKLYLSVADDDLFSGDAGFSQGEPRPEVREILDEVVDRYSYSSDADLKTAVYLTAPMRQILRRESLERLNLYNSPIDFLTS